MASLDFGHWAWGCPYVSLEFRGFILAAVAAICAPAIAHSQTPPATTGHRLVAVGLPSMSAECRSSRLPGEQFRRPLRGLSRAVRAQRPLKVLAIGSSSTVGIGASSPTATYVARLETTLEGALKGLEVQVLGRGLSGEVAQGAAERMKIEVEAIKPDLVVWQVGTNDALRHVTIDSLTTCLRTTLAWLAERRVEVVLIDPQYGEALVKNEHYERVVAAIATVAREARVLLVDRFEAMRELHRQRGDGFYLASDNLHLNDTGHRCMAEQLARSIVGGLMAADAESAHPVFYP